ncbi:MAG: hypothetical protein ABI673_06630 [Novosphingobium sp.]
MDNYRGDFLGSDAYDSSDEDSELELPPAAIGQDERRMQVRAYNLWASLLDNRTFPLIADLETGHLPEFDPCSVLLDFSGGVEDPAIRYLGSRLALECGDGEIHRLSDVPGRTLLSRITDHYMQIHANQAPIGFEAEFVNLHGRTIMYRGILLPFSGSLSSSSIDLIYGVISWKELADEQTTDALHKEFDRVLAAKPARRASEPLTEWADGPADMAGDVLDLNGPFGINDDGGLASWPEPDFAASANDDTMSLGDWLAAAREMAQAAQGSEDRSRQALYTAIGRAWDFALAAAAAPQEFSELLDDAGLSRQDRAPLTPVVKLVFGADYDKTRLTEYGTAMAHAQRLGLERGALAAFLAAAPGGLKGVVHAERRLRREESGKPATHADTPREAQVRAEVTRRLRTIAPRPLADLDSGGDEFTLVIAQRTPSGEVMLVGEVGSDIGLLERAVKRLLG